MSDKFSLKYETCVCRIWTFVPAMGQKPGGKRHHPRCRMVHEQDLVVGLTPQEAFERYGQPGPPQRERA